MRRLTIAALFMVLLSACSGSNGSDGSSPGNSSDRSSADAVQQTCEEVRAGIDAFNQQDYDGTVDHFEKAEIPAKAYAEANDEPDAAALLEAVQYYADLAPEDYEEAARSSESFARNKAITLGQCASGEPLDESPATPGTPV